jgi:hypothetical protein
MKGMSLEITEELIARQTPEAQAIIRALLAKIQFDGAEKHDEGYPPDALEKARKVASDFLADAKFANVPAAQRANV